MKIKHYVTAFSNDVLKLDREVNDLLTKGYQPFGSPYISDSEIDGHTNRFLACQAMVLYEDTAQRDPVSSLV